MNQIATSVSICLMVAFLIGCSNSTVSNDAKQFFDEELSTVIKIDQNTARLNLDSIVSKYNFTQLETTEECLIGEVYKVTLRNNKYYILDRHQRKALFVFDENGKFCNFIGRRGRGPGEFTEPTDFVLLDSVVMVFDMFGRKFLYYNLDGSYVKSVPLKYIIYEVESNSDGSAMYAISGDNDSCDSLRNFEIFRITPNGQILFKSFENSYSMNYSDKFDLQCFNDNIIYKKALRPAVYQLSDNKLYARYIFDIASYALPPNYEERCKGDFEKFISEFKDEYAYFNGQFWETDRYVGIGVTSKQLPLLVIYDKDTRQTISGLVGITFGEKSIDTNGLFTSVMSGVVDVAGNQIIGVFDEAKLPLESRVSLFGKAADDDFSNPTIITMYLRPHQSL